MQIKGTMSKGSAISAAENLSAQCMQLQNGIMMEQSPTAIRAFDFGNGDGQVDCFPVTLPDLYTIHKSTQVANVRTYVHVAGASFPSGDLRDMPDGPTADERDATPYNASVQVTSPGGQVTASVLHTVNGYTFAALASVEGAKQVLGGSFRPGFHTPVEVFGDYFLETVGQTTVVNVNGG
jgi:hypothetical protein